MRAAKGAASNRHAASYERVAWSWNVATDYSGASPPNVSRDTHLYRDRPDAPI
jgi:hypothetical protein